MVQGLKLLKDWGVTGALVIALVWMNTRIGEVEHRLYDCYEKRVMHVNNVEESMVELIATIPDELKIHINE
jgi:hypothetical protein|tara:strand:- start:753 stop:965 length:213 start_codon:yes stop_codon:yes gene_type:complete